VNAIDQIEQELKAVRQQIVNFVDSGRTNDHPIIVTNGDLCRWFDRLEVVSGYLAAFGDTQKRALERCISELEESLENEGRLASFSSAIKQGRAALTAVTSHNSREGE